MKECSEEIRSNLTDRVGEMRRLKEEILVLIGDTYKKYDMILEENKVFWDEIKKEKTHKWHETERKLDEENRRLREEYEGRNSELVKELKSVDQEKREIVLAIQELRGYYEAREKNYKDEIALLKKTELKMIDFSEKREGIFEEEILRMSSEVAYLEKLYEESLRSNIKNHNEFISNEIRAAKEIMSPTIKNELKEIIHLLKEKEGSLEAQMTTLSEQQLKGLQVVKNSCDSLITLQNGFVDCLELLKGEGNEEFEEMEEVNIEVVKF